MINKADIVDKVSRDTLIQKEDVSEVLESFFKVLAIECSTTKQGHVQGLGYFNSISSSTGLRVNWRADKKFMSYTKDTINNLPEK